ncbi:hypothetical protein SALWKB12_0486 [Snodgrassella communis]|nr:hypothetical protein SALWKB12_0486 [Snodgrassella communis]
MVFETLHLCKTIHWFKFNLYIKIIDFSSRCADSEILNLR